MEADKSTLKYYADWAQPRGRTTKKGSRVHIHPHDLISYVHKKEGLEKAGRLATRLITQKYARLLEQAKLDGGNGTASPNPRIQNPNPREIEI